MVLGSPTSRWSLELILCGFEVHMSTTTSQTESFKLPLEMILEPHQYFDQILCFFGIFIWIDIVPVELVFTLVTSMEIGAWFTKMKIDINLRSFAMPGEVHEVSLVKFWSVGNAWKRSKTDTIPILISAIPFENPILWNQISDSSSRIGYPILGSDFWSQDRILLFTTVWLDTTRLYGPTHKQRSFYYQYIFQCNCMYFSWKGEPNVTTSDITQ